VAAQLNEHARARRAKSRGADLVDFYDVPLHAPYLDAIRAAGGDVVHESRWLNAVSVRAPIEGLRSIAALPFVQRLEPVRSYRVQLPTPTRGGEAAEARGGDPFDYGASRGQLAEINAIDAHAAGYSGAGVIIAMLDTGFEYQHEVFQPILSSGRLLAQHDFIQGDGDVRNDGSSGDAQQHDHGTLTWSTTGGFKAGQLVGPAHGASFLLAKTEEVFNEHAGEEDRWITALEWADAGGADIVSSSLGWLDWWDYSDLDGDTTPSAIAADLAVTRGILVVNSAGNEGSSSWFFIITPADGDLVTAVGAVDEFNNIASFSSHGPSSDGQIKPDVVARGVNTVCAIPPEYGFLYGAASGTSLSAPLVSGAAALVMDAVPTASAVAVRNAFLQTADRTSTPDNLYGYGRIDVMAAIDYLSTVSTPAVVPHAGASLAAAPNPLSTRTRIAYTVPANLTSDPSVQILTVDGRVLRSYGLSPSDRSLTWDGRDREGRPVAPGVYVARLEAGSWEATTKLIVQR
jgi:subtilisin family serine protease